MMNKNHSDILEANSYVNVFLLNMEYGEDSRSYWKNLGYMLSYNILVFIRLKQSPEISAPTNIDKIRILSYHYYIS